MRDCTASDKEVPSTSGGIVKRALKKVNSLLGDQSPELRTDQFRECMTEPLQEARQAWFEAVEVLLTATESVLLPVWSEENWNAIVETGKEDERMGISKAFEELLESWRNQDEDGLLTTISVPVLQNVIKCSAEKEHWKSATD